MTSHWLDSVNAIAAFHLRNWDIIHFWWLPYWFKVTFLLKTLGTLNTRGERDNVTIAACENLLSSI